MPWWAWLVAGCVLGMLELLAPAFIFLGFAIGAVLTGLLLWCSLPPVTWMGDILGWHLVLFAGLSILAWLALRGWAGVRKGQVKLWDRDINDN